MSRPAVYLMFAAGFAWLAAWSACSSCSSAGGTTTDLSGVIGQTVEPPKGLNKIQPGMSVLEARKLVPGLQTERSIRDELTIDSGASDVRLAVRVDSGTVSAITMTITGHGTRELIQRAWGEPQITRDSLGQPEVAWSSEATGWKAKLDCVQERVCNLEFVPYHVLTSDFFGAHVLPLADLAQLRVGMKIADARKIAPGPVDVRAGIPTGVDGVREFVAVDDKIGTIKAMYLNLPAGAEALIADAWGAGTAATEPVGKNVLVWPDPTTGWRATLRPALGVSHDLYFDTYLPVATMFGEQPDVIDSLPVMGATVEEIRKMPQYAKEDIVPIPRTDDIAILLPPTEWDRSQTRVVVDIANGRARALTFSIPFKSHPEARDTLLELFTHKWTAPKDGEEDGKKVLIFRESGPRVEVREDTKHGAWKLEITP
jgi:hypothetical protein